MVRVIGFGRAVKIALDEALERIEVPYQPMQRITSLKETGARRASAISAAFWDTLPRLVLTIPQESGIGGAGWAAMRCARAR